MKSEVGGKVRIHIAHGDPDTRKVLVAITESLGHIIRGVSKTRGEMIEFCSENRPDLIVSGTVFPDGDGIEALIQISKVEPLPAIIVTDKDSLIKVEQAMDDHVMAYLIEPVDSDDLKPTIYVVLRRFEQFKDLQQENADLKESLKTRKLVERAKGILMAQGTTEEDAYLKLRDAATKNRIKMGKVAQMIIDSTKDQKKK